jgi:hypothetical protein
MSFQTSSPARECFAMEPGLVSEGHGRRHQTRKHPNHYAAASLNNGEMTIRVYQNGLC